AKQYEQGKSTLKKHKKTKKYVSSSDESESSSSEEEKPHKKKKEPKKNKPSSDEELDELTKRFNKLQINLMQQVEGIAKRVGSQNRKPRDTPPQNNNYNNSYGNNNYNNNGPRRCYNCNEIGHFAKDCLSEKKPNNRTAEMSVMSSMT